MSSFPSFSQEEFIPSSSFVEIGEASRDGGFRYNYPLKMFEYRGLMPQIGIGYTSSRRKTYSVDSVIAPGWRVTGLSRIERVSVGGGTPTWNDARDIFRLDGADLMACDDPDATNVWAGVYPDRYQTTHESASCSAGGNFAPLVENFLKIKFNGNMGDRSSTFTVWRKDGTRMIYETLAKVGDVTLPTNDAAYNSVNNRVWLLTRIENQQQTVSAVDVEYDVDGLSEGYAWRPTVISAAGYVTQFNYEKMVHPQATFATGATNAIGQQDWRLDSVLFKERQWIMRGYDLEYHSAASPGSEQLASIEEYGSSIQITDSDITGGARLPATTFGYDTAEYSSTVNQHSYTDLGISAPSLQQYDFGDNGTVELVVDGNQYLSLSPDGFSKHPMGEMRNHLDAVKVFDIDARSMKVVKQESVFRDELNDNGEDRYAARITESLNRYAQNGTLLSSNELASYTTTTRASPSRYRTVNLGDPRYPKLISGYFDSTFQDIFTLSGTGGVTSVVEPRTDCPTYNRANANLFGDMNGDGQRDSFFFWYSDRHNQRICQLFGSEFELSTFDYTPSTVFLQAQKRFTSDVNGDGKDDLVAIQNQRVEVALSNGRGFGGFELWANVPVGLTLRSVADVNDDGRADLVLADGADADVRVQFSNGQGFDAATLLASRPNHSKFQAMADLDGDGQQDFYFVRRVPTKRYGFVNGGFTSITTYGPPSLVVVYSSWETQDLLGSITNSAGGNKTISYLPSSSEDVVSDDQIPGVRQLVRHIDVSDGRGQTRRTSYEYSGGRFDWDYRKSLGFSTITTHEPLPSNGTDAPRVVATYLNTNLANKGWPSRTSRYNNADELSRTEIHGDFRFSGNGPFRALKTRERMTEWEQGTPVTRLSSYWHNKFGVETRVTNWGFTSQNATWGSLDTSDDSTDFKGFTPDLERYFVDKPTFRIITKSAGALDIQANWLQYEAYYYDGLGWGQFGASGNLTRISRRAGAEASYAYRDIAHFEYDAFGNVIREIDAIGATTRHTYDSRRNLFVTSTRDALGHVTRFYWNAGLQKPTSTTDHNGLSTTFGFDAFARETSRTLPSGAFTNTEYLDFGNPNLQRVRTSINGTGADSTQSWEFFDGLGQTYKTGRTGATQAAKDAIQTLSMFDARGNLIWESLPHLNADESNHPVGDPNKGTTFSYDLRDRPVRTTYADGEYTTTEYEIHNVYTSGGPHLMPSIRTRSPDCFDFDTRTVCNEELISTDAYGQVVQRIKYDNAQSDVGSNGSWRIHHYYYDRLRRLTAVYDPAGTSWQYTYDPFGNRLTSQDPDMGFWTLEYDRQNNLTRQIDAAGQQIVFTYDVAGRVLSKTTYDNSGAPHETTTYSYDQARPGYFNVGALTEVSNATHTIRYDYENNGQVAREEHVIDGDRTYAIDRTYYANGLPRDMALPNTPNGTSTAWVGEFSYDSALRLTGFGPYVTGATYDVWDNLTQMTFGNGVTEHRTHNANRGWLEQTRVADSNLNDLQRTSWRRAPSGRISRQISTRDKGNFNYRYDYAGRLLHADNFQFVEMTPSGPVYSNSSELQPTDRLFTYNAAGSIVSKSDIGTYTYGAPWAARPHAPTDVNGTALTYDANGNMLQGYDGKVMTYDAENRPLTVTKDGVVTTYVYGADGGRLMQTVGAGTTVTFAEVEIRGFKSGAETILTQPHAIVRLENGGAPSYLHTDHLASIHLITSAAGLVEDQRTYAPFGKMQSWSAPGSTSEQKGWIGERYDNAAELQFLNARYYDPEIGLFLQPDWWEVTEPGVGTNRYAYSDNDPVNKMDPGGNLFSFGPNQGNPWEGISANNSAAENFGSASLAASRANSGWEPGNGDSYADYAYRLGVLPEVQAMFRTTPISVHYTRFSGSSIGGSEALNLTGAELGTAGVLIAADGPFPFGDIVAAGIIGYSLWIGYDIFSDSNRVADENDEYKGHGANPEGKTGSGAKWNKHSGKRSGKRYGAGRNNKRGQRNKKYQKPKNSNKR